MQKVSVGQKLHIPAATFNSFIDAAEFVRNHGAWLSAAVAGYNTQNGILAGMNNTGSDLDAFSVVGISGVEIEPGDNETEFYFRTTLSLATATDRIAVTQEAISSGEIGKVMVFGVTAVEVDIIDAAHEFAAVDTGALKSVEYPGAARIIYKPSGVGVKDCLIYFPAVLEYPSLYIATADASLGEITARPVESDFTTAVGDEITLKVE